MSGSHMGKMISSRLPHASYGFAMFDGLSQHMSLLFLKGREFFPHGMTSAQ
jgi:hypothetical protein